MKRYRLALAAAVSLTAAALARAGSPPDFSGMWLVRDPPTSIRTLQGGEPPLAAGVRRAGPPDPENECLPSGPVRMLFAPYPIKILQRPGQVSFMHEYRHLLRLVRLDARQPEDWTPNWLGSSIGRWEGDELVIETIGLNGETWLDRTGLPSSEATKVVERIRLIGGGRSLEDVITVEDPKLYARPWSTRLVFDRRPDLRLEQNICGEDADNRPLPIPPARR